MSSRDLVTGGCDRRLAEPPVAVVSHIANQGVATMHGFEVATKMSPGTSVAFDPVPRNRWRRRYRPGAIGTENVLSAARSLLVTAAHASPTAAWRYRLLGSFTVCHWPGAASISSSGVVIQTLLEAA